MTITARIAPRGEVTGNNDAIEKMMQEKDPPLAGR